MEPVLLEKVPQGRSKEFLDELKMELRRASSGLAVDVRISGLTANRLPRLQVSGDDQDVFSEILRRTCGLSPRSPSDLLDQPIRKGFVQEASKRENALLIDIGLESDPPHRVLLGADRLRAQLLDGRNVSLPNIVTRYVLVENFPLELRVMSFDEDNRRVQVELSDRQWSLFGEWRELPFDRIIAQDVLNSEVRSAVKRTGLDRDLAAIESLSLATHSLVCKLGTDGQGLVPKLGPYLRKARMFVFHPDSRDFRS